MEYRLVVDSTADLARELALAAWKALGCRDAGRVDLRLDASGTPNIMEVNPLPGLHPEHSDLPISCNLAGIAYQELIRAIVQSAMNRMCSPELYIPSQPPAWADETGLPHGWGPMGGKSARAGYA